MQKITPFLWFDKQAEEAIQFYTSVFKNSKIHSIDRYPNGPLEGPMKGLEGKVLTGLFELEGQQFMALDGGSYFKFTPAISFFVNASNEEEVNRLWEMLSAGGETLMPLQEYPFSKRFGWIKDKFGLSWQLNLAANAQKIVPFLMFVGEQAGKAEEAIRFYTSLFEHSGIDTLERSDDGGYIQQGAFRLDDKAFMAIDSAENHDFSFNEAISLYVNCQSQEEVDHFWNKLSADPKAEQCGWLKDRYGVSWQIVPEKLNRLLKDPDPVKAKRVMDAMLKMKKIEVAELEKAAQG